MNLKKISPGIQIKDFFTGVSVRLGGGKPYKTEARGCQFSPFCFRNTLLVMILLCNFGCGGSSKYMIPTTELSSPDENRAVVRFFRPSRMTGKVKNYAILDNEKAIGNLSNDTQFDFVASPGKHLFISTGSGTDPFFLEADLEAGKTYYVLTRVTMGMTAVRFFLTPITPGSEDWEKIEEYQEDLARLTPDLEKLDEWSAHNSAEIKELISNYHKKWKQEYQSAWTKLIPEDGI